jgi:hypothetical protein
MHVHELARAIVVPSDSRNRLATSVDCPVLDVALSAFAEVDAPLRTIFYELARAMAASHEMTLLTVVAGE